MIKVRFILAVALTLCCATSLVYQRVFAQQKPTGERLIAIETNAASESKRVDEVKTTLGRIEDRISKLESGLATLQGGVGIVGTGLAALHVLGMLRSRRRETSNEETD